MCQVLTDFLYFTITPAVANCLNTLYANLSKRKNTSAELFANEISDSQELVTIQDLEYYFPKAEPSKNDQPLEEEDFVLSNKSEEFLKR